MREKKERKEQKEMEGYQVRFTERHKHRESERDRHRQRVVLTTLVKKIGSLVKMSPG